MTTLQSYDRQPSKTDYASPAQFRFQLFKLPKVEYFCTSVNLPGISLSTRLQQTPLADIPLPGEKLDYSDLELTFLVDENLENFREIHGWMTGLAFPEDHSEYQTLLNAGQDRFPTTVGTQSKTDPGKVSAPTPMGAAFSDATLHILTSKNNANIEVRFNDVFPISLSSLNFNQQANDVDYLQATVGFKYKLYEFALKGAFRTSETVS